MTQDEVSQKLFGCNYADLTGPHADYFKKRVDRTVEIMQLTR